MKLKYSMRIYLINYYLSKDIEMFVFRLNHNTAKYDL